MAKHTARHGNRRSLLGSLAVLVVVALSGYLLMTNLRVNRTATVSSDTADLVEQRVERVEQLSEDVKELSSQIDTFTDLAAGSAGTTGTDAEDAGSGAMLRKVEGPGVTVILNDSPMWEQVVNGAGTTANINDYVIHQEDIEGVINALWQGGADSMMFEDQRLLSTSAVLCSGNVVSLHGKKYSPPFHISAIGDPEKLTQALDDSPAIKLFKQYVSLFGLGWEVKTKESLEFPSTAVSLQPLKYATVAGDGNDGADASADNGAGEQTTNGGTDNGANGADGSSSPQEGQQQ